MRELQARAGLGYREAAALCGVSLRTYRLWRSQGNPAPAAVRLLAILAGFVPWDGWDGWEVHRGCFFPPGFSKGGISPGEFLALVFWRQQVSEYRRKNAELVRLLARADAQLAELRELLQEDQRPPKAKASTAGQDPDGPSNTVRKSTRVDFCPSDAVSEDAA